tara:strand:+ start:478 stop:1479 length:1002 start_codon:yes stop_codon:yes gene_type:complete
MPYTLLVIVILAISLVLYALFGVADFGAGIVEIFIGKKGQKTISQAIGPVWEANHIWLILIVVILFNGFPNVYAVFSTALHIPILIFLIGIIARGTAFVFRHYDAYTDKSQTYYSIIFRYSSLLAVMFLGVLLAAIFSGTIQHDITDFYSYFLAPWLTLFSFSIGIFVCILSAYLAAILLLSEAEDEEEYKIINTFSKRLLIGSILSGGLIFLASYVEDFSFHKDFFSHIPSLIAFILATVLVPLIFLYIHKRNNWVLRILSGLQIILILAGWFLLHWPNLITFADASTLNIYEAAAAPETMKVLFWALLIGSCLIFPSLYYLFKVFKFKETN